MLPPPEDESTPNQAEAGQGQHGGIGFGHKVRVRVRGEIQRGPSGAATALAAKTEFKTLAGRNSYQGPKGGQHDACSVRPVCHDAAAEKIAAAGDIRGGYAGFGEGQARPSYARHVRKVLRGPRSRGESEVKSKRSHRRAGNGSATGRLAYIQGNIARSRIGNHRGAGHLRGMLKRR